MLSNLPKEFIIKDPDKAKPGTTCLPPAFEKMASDLYELCGVEVPKTYLIKKNESGHVSYLLASKKLSGYKDLHDYFDTQENEREKAQEKIENLDRLERVNREEHLLQYKHFLNQLNIVGLEKLLVASIFLQDFDVIGRGFNNIGLIAEGRLHKIIKIDPGNAKLQGNKVDFKSQMDVNNPLIISANLPENDFIGIFNTRFREVFQLANEDKILTAIAHLIRIPNEFLCKIVFNVELLKEKIITKEQCEAVFNALQERRQAFAEVYKAKLCEKELIEEDYEEIQLNLSKNYSALCKDLDESIVKLKIDSSIFNFKKVNSNQKKIILEAEMFLYKKEKIPIGNSRPRIFYKKSTKSELPEGQEKKSLGIGI